MIDHGYGVRLERLDPNKDARVTFEWRNDPRVYRFCRQSEPLHWDRHMAWFGNQARDESLSMFRVMHGDQIVGVTGLTSIDRQNRRAEFSLYIDPDNHRRKLGRKALCTLLTHGFKTLGLRVIWGESFDFNAPASRLFQACGMALEGERRDFYFKEGRFVSANLYSMTGDEWKQHCGSWSAFVS